MAISRIAGQMLQSNLERDGVNLAIETDLLYIDVANNRVGINQALPSTGMDINSDMRANNVQTMGNVVPMIDLVYNLGEPGNRWANVYANLLVGNVTGNISGNIFVPGSNTEVVFNDSGVANASPGLTFDKTSSLLDVSGNVIAANLQSNNEIVAAGNITGGNLIVLGQVLATGNVSGGNLNSNGEITAAGNISASGTIDAVGNITGNNLIALSLTSPSELDLNSSLSGNIVITPSVPGITKIVGTNGVVIPVGNTAQRPAIPDAGTLRYNTTSGVLEIFNGTVWDTSTGGTATITDQLITPDGVSNTFVLTETTTTAAILVVVNGVTQTPAVAYTVTGNSITFAEVPQTTDIISIRYLTEVSTVSELTNTYGNTLVRCNDTPDIQFQINGANAAVITAAEVFDISSGHSLQLPVYTVANATALANTATGQVIYVSDGDSGNPCLAVYSGGAWKQVALGATIST